MKVPRPRLSWILFSRAQGGTKVKATMSLNDHCSLCKKPYPSHTAAFKQKTQKTPTKQNNNNKNHNQKNPKRKQSDQPNPKNPHFNEVLNPCPAIAAVSLNGPVQESRSGIDGAGLMPCSELHVHLCILK